MALPPSAWRRRLPWVIALSLLLAAVGGAAIGWYRSRHQAAPPPEPAAADAGAVEAMFSLEKRERFLLLAAEQYADPGNDQGKVREGVKFAVELGLLYLDDKLPRLDDAEQLFKKLIDNPHNVKAYGAVGRLGLGIVLAFRNRPEESARLFMEVPPDIKKFDGLQQAMLHPNFRHKIVEALNFNEKNLEAQMQKLPQEMVNFRKYLLSQPIAPPRRPGPEKVKGTE